MFLRGLVLLLVTVIATSCIGGPTSRVYVMSAPIASEQTTTSQGSAPTLQVETASLPAFLDNNDILVRRGPYALESSQTGHWGERLSLGITHALAADLGRRLPGYTVGMGPPHAPGDRRLRVEVDSFDVYPDGHCVLSASWSVHQKSASGLPTVGHGLFATPASAVAHADDEQLIRSMSTTVNQLADAIFRGL
jgi:uncharacterized lipoprotein YmbA